MNLSDKITKFLLDGIDSANGLIEEWHYISQDDKLTLSFRELVFAWIVAFPGSPEKEDIQSFMVAKSKTDEDSHFMDAVVSLTSTPKELDWVRERFGYIKNLEEFLVSY